MPESPTAFARNPTLHYCLLVALGAFGVYVSMPIDLNPQSTVERIDLAINLAIFIPCIFIAVVSGLLAIFSVVFSRQIDEEGRFARFALMILRAFGMPGLSLGAFLSLTPLGFLGSMFAGKYRRPG